MIDSQMIRSCQTRTQSEILHGLVKACDSAEICPEPLWRPLAALGTGVGILSGVVQLPEVVAHVAACAVT